MKTSDFQKQYWERNKINKRRLPTHPVIMAFVNSKINYINKFIDFSSCRNLLDVGAGNGYFSYYFEKILGICAIDYSEKMIALNPAKNKQLMDAANLQFKNNSFDIVFESCMLHHVDDINKVIREMKRVSNKYLIFIEPNPVNPLTFLFGLVIKEERKSLPLFKKFLLKKIMADNDLKLINAASHGIIAPNKTPKILLPGLKIFDKKIPFLGLDNIIICQKIKESA